MKLAEIFSEARVHPDLLPVLNNLTTKLIEKVKAAGVEMMPATTDLGYEQGWYSSTDPKPHDRWSWSRSGPIWKAGYIKMGPLWIAVYITIQGHVWTERQKKWGGKDDPQVGEERDRWFKDFDAFIKYLEKTYKPFVGQEPADRLLGFFHKQSQLTLKYEEPVEIKSGEGLDDEDTFQKRGGRDNIYYGMMNLADALAERMVDGKPVDYRDVAILVETGTLHDWLERSGFEDTVMGGRNFSAYVAIASDEIYSADHNGERQEIMQFSPEVTTILQRFATEVIKKIMRVAKGRDKRILLRRLQARMQQPPQ